MKQTKNLVCLLCILILVCTIIPYETFTCQTYSGTSSDNYNSLILEDDNIYSMYADTISTSNSGTYWRDRSDISNAQGNPNISDWGNPNVQFNRQLANCVKNTGENDDNSNSTNCEFAKEVTYDKHGKKLENDVPGKTSTIKCIGCQGYGWCVSQNENGMEEGNCVKADFNNKDGRPSGCDCGWSIGCKDYGTLGTCIRGDKGGYYLGKCDYVDMNISKAECNKCKKDDMVCQNKCRKTKIYKNLYQDYNSCIKENCKTNKNSEKCKKCIDIPDNGGHGCLGNEFTDMETYAPINPDKNDGFVCEYNGSGKILDGCFVNR